MTRFASIDALRKASSADVLALNRWDDAPSTPECKPHKYHARATTVDGVTFASQKEAREYQALCTLERMGLITGLRLQPRYELQPAFDDATGHHHRRIDYVGDFAFTREGKEVVVDTKGVRTPVFAIKEKLFRFKYPHIILEVR